MSRHLDNLKRLFCKLQVRYGEQDEMVLQVKHELDSRESVESGYQHGPIPYGDGLPGNAAQRRRDVASRHTPRSASPQ